MIHLHNSELFTNTISGAEVLIIEKLYRNSTVLYIINNEVEIDNFVSNLKFFIKNINVIVLEGWDSIPYTKTSPSFIKMARRIYALKQIIELQKNSDNFIIVTSVSAVTQKVLPKKIVQDVGISLSINQKITQEHLVEKLISYGYVPNTIIGDRGEFSVRGGIVDIFVPTQEMPIRLDFSGNVIETIKEFNIETQITDKNSIECVTIYPISEVIKDKVNIDNFIQKYTNNSFDKDQNLINSILNGNKYIGEENWLPLFYQDPLETIFDYIPDANVIYFDNVLKCIEERENQIKLNYNDKFCNYDKLYLIDTEFYKKIELNKKIVFCEFDDSRFSIKTSVKVDFQFKRALNFKILAKEKNEDIFKIISEYLNTKDIKLILACYSIGSLEFMVNSFKRYGIHLIRVGCYFEANHKYNIAILPFSNSFSNEEMLFLTENDILEKKSIKAGVRTHAKISSLVSEEINIEDNDIVVHDNYGIGRFSGLETMHIMGKYHDFIKILYYNNDKLFIPVENINLITKHGENSSDVILDKLGNTAWQERQAKLKKHIKNIAQDLLQIEAKRKSSIGKIFELNSKYKEFCANFPFIETEDQLNAIADVESDLSSGKLMDRLICGDVGFGKTEVALRAACLVVSNDNTAQVVVLVPTTLLCSQHFSAFIQRFKGFDSVKIKQISRINTKKEKEQLQLELETGEVNIVIGTHALFSKNITFFNLELIIIDEEHNFGVKQKELLKQLKSNTHVLYLSATPIPRTLHMSLSGLKDLSIIKTPPFNRLPVKIFVSSYDKDLIRNAITYEYTRGGRVFYVCPYISDIDYIYKELSVLLPNDIKVEIVHGKVSVSKLDKTMKDFFDGKFTVLLSTSIIESGIDIPFANTIIIHNADSFGLAQLYQLKGRVGRSGVQGYAYLTLSSRNSYNKLAIKRLEIIKSMDGMHSGFSLSLQDMDIRGFGNLIGEEQSGHVKEVGIELYHKMLEEEISLYKHYSSTKIDPNIKVDIGVDVRIPDTYISDLNLKMRLYKRISAMSTKNEIDDITIELIDRFGIIPYELENLLSIIYIKQLCSKLFIKAVSCVGNIINLQVKKNAVFSEELLKYIISNPAIFKLKDQYNILIFSNTSDADKLIKILIGYLEHMCKLNG